jgi:thioredoxin 1
MPGPDTFIVTDSSFNNDVLQSQIPVLVDFWGEGCGGCRQIAPTIDTVAREYAGKAKIATLDVGSNTRIAMRYGIRSIPTLLLFRGGNVVAHRVGPIGKEEVRKMLDPFVAEAR